jgi:2-polyprenyl-6-hydroxyphenyl methylase/3-demethylubiquinone-9 3-methyltransferase
MSEAAASSSVDPAEVEKFSRLAAEWWEPFGKFRPLHKFNPVRLAYIRDAACAHFARDRLARAPLEGLNLLDIGCGGGLVSEPMRRLGASVVGVDPSERNIAVAKTHATQVGLDIDYRVGSAETLLVVCDRDDPSLTPPFQGREQARRMAESEPIARSVPPPERGRLGGGQARGDAVSDGDQFDIVLNLEAVEHAADPDLFLESCARLVKPGGLMVVATINRTLKAFALAKVAAEYVLRWIPAGTHDPRKFLRPEEVEASLRRAGLTPMDRKGVVYNPLLDVWRLSDDVGVNYMVTAVKPTAA